MFQIKICGITNPDDGRAAAQAGADAVGLNFYPKSLRCIAPETARAIIAALPARVVKVGLFVNAPVSEVCRLFDDLQLDLIQLHGDEPPEFLARLGGRPAMRAFRVGEAGLSPVFDYLRHCGALGAMPVVSLLDSLMPGVYGGTGTTANWSAAREYVAQAGLPPLALAGGLTPENVAEAIRAVRPSAVDVAGGVESAPGKKDAALIESFVRAARAAFAKRNGAS